MNTFFKIYFLLFFFVICFIANGTDVNAENQDDKTILHRASFDGDIEKIKSLIKKGVDVNCKGEGGDTPLVAAAGQGHIDIVKLLIDKGADVNAKGQFGYTPLLKAVDHSQMVVDRIQYEIAEYLIAKGADVNAKEERDGGLTALFYATAKGNKELVKLLLASGTDVMAKDDQGRMPLYYAINKDQENIAELLRKYGGERPGERVVRFDKAIGKYEIVDWDIDVLKIDEFIEEEDFVEAYGEVVVPSGKALILIVNPAEYCENKKLLDLSCLGKIDPSALIGLAIPFVEVTPSEMKYISHFTSLRYFALSGLNNIKDECLKSLSELTQLRVLTLPETKITDSGLKHIKTLRNLEAINLFGTKITDVGLSYISGMNELKKLRIGFTRVTNDGMKHIENLTNLEVLQLGNTQVDDKGLALISRLIKLKNLNLYGTGVTDEGLIYLKGMTKLKRLDIGGTKVSSKGIKNVRKVFPELEYLGRYNIK